MQTLYRLISGKVNNVNYQHGYADAFYHKYSYDAENRLTEVKTSRDKLQWETDAAYTYYKHGPLARTELGQLRVQGIDYAYTIQGWLKGINQTSLTAANDIGQDAYSGSPNAPVAKDALSYALHYYDQTVGNTTLMDYKAISGANTFARPNGANMQSLYNGNIAAMTVNNEGLLNANHQATNSMALLYR